LDRYYPPGFLQVGCRVRDQWTATSGDSK
jgi:hypothetical protein